MSGSAEAVWRRFDELTEDPSSESPWSGPAETRIFTPDLDLLRALIGVPIEEAATVQSGLHAKAVDVWLAQELRRAGFGRDEVWPRATRPRVLPREVALLLNSLPIALRDQVFARILRTPRGVAAADASVLGRAYNKQVDVGISQWARGPELLISSKRMHSSLSNNAFNRIEESYGDARNLRGRHPLAAIGYVLLIRGSAIRESKSSAERLIDLVYKLGQDPAGYDATAVVVADWDESAAVSIDDQFVLEELEIGHFLHVMIDAVLERTPVDAHVRVRELRSGQTLAVAEDESR